MKTCRHVRLLLWMGVLVLSWETPDGAYSPARLLAAEEEQAPKTATFTGTWNNRKTGANGPLKCVATETEPGQWKGTFSGTFHNDPFSYDAEFQVRAARNQTTASGTANIRGHDYQWTGTYNNGRLSARYRSNVGYFGEFVMREVKPEP